MRHSLPSPKHFVQAGRFGDGAVRAKEINFHVGIEKC